MKFAFLTGVVAIAGAASAFQGVVPPNFAGAESPGGFFLTNSSSAWKTYQLTIDSSQLTAFVGSTITDLDFRLNGGVNYPVAGPINFTNFDVFMGAGVDPSAMSNTFADNFTGAVTQVRGGALTVSPGDYPGGTSANGFGGGLGFNLSNYTYNGGDLTVLFRFSSSVSEQFNIDAVLGTDPGYGSLYAGRWAENASATTAQFNAQIAIMQFTAEAVPEPATMVVLGLGAAALIRRRRK